MPRTSYRWLCQGDVYHYDELLWCGACAAQGSSDTSAGWGNVISSQQMAGLTSGSVSYNTCAADYISGGIYANGVTYYTGNCSASSSYQYQFVTTEVVNVPTAPDPELERRLHHEFAEHERRLHPDGPYPGEIEQRLAAMAAADQARAAVIQRQRARSTEEAKAHDRAMALLTEHLSPEQREMLRDREWIIVKGSITRSTYRVKMGRVRNIARLDVTGCAIDVFCIHPEMNCPDPDTVLCQMLMIETDEREFLKVANRSSRSSVPLPPITPEEVLLPLAAR